MKAQTKSTRCTPSPWRAKNPIRPSRLIIFGNAADPDVKEALRKAKATGRHVEVQKRSEFQDGTGACGKCICSCKGIEQCKLLANQGAYPGDQGSTMGQSY